MILVDTSVQIDFFNGADSEEKTLLHKLISNHTRITITDIILTEILQGIRDIQQFERVKNTLTQLNVLHATPIKTYIHAAEIYHICREKGFNNQRD